MKLDWSTKNSKSNMVQWAAFYSDCEHEVLPVSKGYRLTLTCNLYAERISEAKLARSMEVELPLMKYARNIINDKTFMPKGLVLSATPCFTHIG